MTQSNSIFSCFVILGLFCITQFTSKDLIEEYGRLDFYKEHFLYSLLSLFLTNLSLFILQYFVKFDLFYLTGLISIGYYTLFLTWKTDKKIRRINRFTMRFAYILNFILIIFFELYLYQNLNFVVYISALLGLIIGFFLISGVGASDYRCWMITIINIIFFFKSFAIMVIIIHFVQLGSYMMKEQKDDKKKKVPIGQQIMGFNLLTILIGIFLI